MHLPKTVKTTRDNVNRIRYAVAQIPTPIFNTPIIPFFNRPLKKDDQGLIREIETIAFPGTKFKLLSAVSSTIAQVETDEYTSSAPLFADVRFLKETAAEPPERNKKLPSSKALLDWLKSCQGTRYFWGGNWEAGIPQMLDFYPAPAKEDQDNALCRGLDCSGFLYQGTDGMTPRNTTDLIHWGQELKLHHLSPLQIQQQLKPLDLLVWKGHVVIVLTPDTMIESRVPQGVVISDFQHRYHQITELLNKTNKTLYFRRWHPDFLHLN